MIDTDAQGTLTESLGVKKRPAFYNWIARHEENEFSDVVTDVPLDAYTVAGQQPRGWAGLIASNWESSSVNKAPVSPIVVQQRLMEAGETFPIDLAVIDPPPSESEIHPWLVYSADYVLVPTQCVDESYRSMKNTLKYIKDNQPTRLGLGLPETQVIGIQPTMYSPKTVIVQRDYLVTITEEFSNAKPPIPVYEPIMYRSAWAECVVRRQSIFAYEPGSKAAQEAENMVRRVADAIGVSHE